MTKKEGEGSAPGRLQQRAREKGRALKRPTTTKRKITRGKHS